MLVYVLNKNGEPLMPCSPRKARILLKGGKAFVKKKEPFTIQLKHGSSGYKQNINLGVDAGSEHIGLSATTEKKVLFESDILLRNDITKLLEERKGFRKARRNRKTRYRKTRFLNRVKSKHKGWLAPSVEQKINCHITSIQKVCRLLPIKKIIVETAQFDIQKLQNPNIQGKEYQQGKLYGFANAREYVLNRDNYTCQHCKGKSKDFHLHIHHIIFRRNGGSDDVDNLITLCKTCHNSLHNGEFKIIKLGKAKQGLKHSTFMNTMRKTLLIRLKNIFQNVEEIFGYITKELRFENDLSKEHYIDARCISGNPKAETDGTIYFQKKVRCHNRKLHKANILKGNKKKNNQAQFKVLGFRLFDKVKYLGKRYFVFGRRNSGFFDIRNIDFTEKIGSIKYNLLKLIGKRENYLIERRVV